MIGTGRDFRIFNEDVLSGLSGLRDCSVQCVVTSPPYWGLRDYGTHGQIGLEPTPESYVTRMVAVFREVRRVLARNGVLWLNLGDSYFKRGPCGTVGVVALRLNRRFVGVEINPEYAAMAEARIENDAPLLNRRQIGDAA